MNSIESRKNPDSAIDYEDDPADLDYEDVEKIFQIWPMEEHPKTINHSRMIPIIDARLSVTYNLGDFFFNANAQVHDFRFKDNDRNKGSLTDWYVNASVGLRL